MELNNRFNSREEKFKLKDRNKKAIAAIVVFFGVLTVVLTLFVTTAATKGLRIKEDTKIRNDVVVTDEVASEYTDVYIADSENDYYEEDTSYIKNITDEDTALTDNIWNDDSYEEDTSLYNNATANKGNTTTKKINKSTDNSITKSSLSTDETDNTLTIIEDEEVAKDSEISENKKVDNENNSSNNNSTSSTTGTQVQVNADTGSGSQTVTVHLNTLQNDDYNIVVKEITENSLGDATDVKVEDKSEELLYESIQSIVAQEKLGSSDIQMTTLDIELVDNMQQEVQPNGTVKVYMEIPEGMSRTSFAVYYLGDGDEKPVKVNGKIEGDNFVFERNHFCQFCLVSEDIQRGQDSSIGLANVSWFVNNADADIFYLSTGADLRGLALLSTGDITYIKSTGYVSETGLMTALQTSFAGKTIVLTNDITMSSAEYIGIGDRAHPFAGTFDGNGYVIKNLNLNAGATWTESEKAVKSSAFIHVLGSTGEVRNLGLEETKLTPVFTDSDINYASAFVGANSGKVTNVYLYNSEINVTYNNQETYVAGLVAKNATGAKVRNAYEYDNGVIITNSVESGNHENLVLDSLVATVMSSDDYSNLFASTLSQVGNNYEEITATNISSSSLTGVAYRLNVKIAELNLETPQGETNYYINWKVGSTHPLFNGERVDDTVTVEAVVIVDGFPDVNAGNISVNGIYRGSSCTATMYAGYKGPTFTASGTNVNYTFRGWFSDPSGDTKYRLTQDESFTVTDFKEATYYAIYIGGQYSLRLEAVGHGKVYSENQKIEDAVTDETIGVNRHSRIAVHAIPEDGYKFVRWQQVIKKKVTEKDAEGKDVEKEIEEIKEVSKSITDYCAYTYMADIASGYLQAVFEPSGVAVKLGYTSDSSEGMGSLTNKNSVFTEPGKTFEVTAKPSTGYVFVGWYATDNIEGNEPLSTEMTYKGTLPEDYEFSEITFYARFRTSGPIDVIVKGEAGIISVKDEGHTLSKVLYQYSGDTEYRWYSWLFFVRNGQGKDMNGNPKTDYDTNRDKYLWNGKEGYRTLSSNINETDIFVQYPGWYTFLLYDKDDNLTVKAVQVTESDFSGNLQKPVVTQKFTTFTIDPKGQDIVAVYYQLTSTNVSATTCPIPYTDWTKFVKAGKASAVVEDNGPAGYKAMEKNKEGVITTTVHKTGWYTIFIKYGKNYITTEYKRVTEEDIEDSRGGVISVHANYSLGSNGFAVFDVKTPAVDNATEYGIYYENSLGIKTYEKMWGSFRAKRYLVYIKGLKAGEKYKLTPTATVGGQIISNGDTVGFSAAAATVTTNVSGYYATKTNGISYSNKTPSTGLGRLDMEGARSIRTTFGDGGWALFREDSSSEETSYSQTSSVQIIPTLGYVTGTSGTEYVQFKYILRNNTASQINNYSFAIGADTQIGSLDSAPISRTNYGLTMSDNSGNILALIANESINIDGLGGKSTTATSIWYGAYSGHRSTNNRYTNVTTPVSGVDSAMIVAFNKISLGPGETKEFKVIMGVVGTGALKVDPSVPSVSVNDGLFDLSANNTPLSTNIFNSVNYAYVSSDITQACPFNYNTSTNNIKTLETQGLKYRGINGAKGYMTIEGELIEEGENQNNLVDYTEPGWYTFVFNYTNRTYVSETDKSHYTDSKKCLTANVKVTEADIKGKPLLHKNGNTFTVLNNDSGLINVTYQLSDIDTESVAPYLFNGWSNFVKNGQGLTKEGGNRPNKEIYVKANTNKGYEGENTKEIMEKDPDKTSFTYIVTTAGWYTVLLQYPDPDDTKKTLYLYKYVLFTADDVNIEGPKLEKNHNEITYVDNTSDLKRAFIQLTTQDFDTYATEESLKERYGYGTGQLYKVVGTNQFKNDNRMSDFAVYARIGQYKNTEQIAAGTKDPTLTSINTNEGYIKSFFKEMDGRAYRFTAPGWYTVILEYGDDYQIAKYIKVTEEDLSYSPIVNIDSDTGIITIQANGYDIKHAYIQYTAPYNNEPDLPSTYVEYMKSWTKFWKYGQTIAPDFNGQSGYRKIDMESGHDVTGTTAVWKSGWYTIYINEASGDRVVYLALEQDAKGPELEQVIGNELAKDARLCINYKDHMTEVSYPIQKFAYGFIGETAEELPENLTKDPYTINSYYRMTKACNGDVITVTNADVKANADGREFHMAVSREGYYSIMVVDHYYGTMFYEAYISDDDVTVRTIEDSHAPGLSVTGKTITGIQEDGSVEYMKLIQSTLYKHGNVLKAYAGGNQRVNCIDDEGRVFELAVVLKAIPADTDELEKLMKEAQTKLIGIESLTEAEFEALDKESIGYFGVDTYVTQVSDLLRQANELLENVNGKQTDVDELVIQMSQALKNFDKYSIMIEPELVAVEGSTIRITPPDGYTLQYVIYNVQELTDIETGYKPPKAVVWQDWMGIMLDEYYKVPTFKDNTYTLENVENGIYTFMIKIAQKDGDASRENIYFRNPIVHVDDTAIDIAIRELTVPGTSMVAMANYALSNMTSESHKEEGKPFISDKLYKTLKDETAAAEKLALEVVKKMNEGTDTDEDTTKVVNEIATLHMLLRKVESGVIEEVVDQELELTTVDNTTGRYVLVNPQGGMNKAYIAKGYYEKWADFCAAPYKECEIKPGDGSSKKSDISVTSDGYYTIYCSFDNKTYQFLQFRTEGYAGEPISVTSDGLKINIEVSEDIALRITKLAYTGELKNKYESKQFKNIKLNSNNKAQVPVLSSDEHTVYVKIGSSTEYFIYIAVAETPIVQTGKCTVAGMSVKITTSPQTIEWVAFAKGEYDSWTDMLQAEGGVHYIAQNETVNVPDWTTSSDTYTFFYKGQKGMSDYIAHISGEDASAASEGNTTYDQTDSQADY